MSIIIKVLLLVPRVLTNLDEPYNKPNIVIITYLIRLINFLTSVFSTPKL